MTMCREPRPAPRRCSATAAAFASFSIATGTPNRSASRSRSGDAGERDVHRVDRLPARWSIVDGMPIPIAPMSSLHEARRSPARPAPEAASSLLVSVALTTRVSTTPSSSTIPESSFVPPRSSAITRGAATASGYDTRSRGAQGQAVPGLPRGESQRARSGPSRRSRPQGEEGQGERTRAPLLPRPKPARTRRRWVRPVAWTARRPARPGARLGECSASSPSGAASRRRTSSSTRAPTRALAPQDGIMLSNPSNILVLGADDGSKTRQGSVARSDSIMIVRTDPDEHRIALLSIPRDLRVEIPGHGEDKINAAFAYGGPTLAIKTVQSVTGLPINHVVVVDFAHLQRGHRRPRRGHDRRPEADPLQQVRLPARDRGALRPLEGLALQEGRADDERQARADLRARCARTSSTRRSPTSRAASASRRSSRRWPTRSSASRSTCRRRSSATTSSKPLATDLSAAQILQLGWIKFRTPSSG